MQLLHLLNLLRPSDPPLKYHAQCRFYTSPTTATFALDYNVLKECLVKKQAAGAGAGAGAVLLEQDRTGIAAVIGARLPKVHQLVK